MNVTLFNLEKLGDFQFPFFNRQSVLIVEDDPNDADLLTEALQAEGYKVVRAHSAEEALGILHDNGRRYVFLMVDVGLPRMDGIEFVEKIYVDFPQLKVFLMSGSSSRFLELTAGTAFGSIVKPTTDKYREIVQDIKMRWL